MDPDNKRCRQCGIPLGAFEGKVIPCTFPASPSFNIPSGELGCYCDECYADETVII